uniref:RNA 3'-terminal-phosphate cyclase (ATP) n=1 Tax=Eutreptiella gymnastica TaxID=73025 RepID=A0A7S1IWZ8_9EUGL|mmetsp:Transcript_49728/g.88912  ORF Transcript_49728/g.88912 Transcript_49728/m.88912 type:complete len:374 (+) Transcript_49728:37-1158(+)
MSAKGAVQETGSRFFRQNIILATLSGKAVEISDIRPKDMNPGVRGYEGNFLKLMARFTNGCRIEINDTGTLVKYKPGVIVGGQFTHDCSCERGIGYWLEALICLAPFAKQPTQVILTGVTNKEIDIGVDIVRTVTMPLLQKFGVDASLKILRRGAPPLGGGRVSFVCSPVRKLQAIELVEEGKIKRIRGLAYSARISPDLANRMVHSAKGLLLKLLPDIFITSDHFRGDEAGLSPGFGITLVAESTNKGDLFLAEEVVPEPEQMTKDQLTPEDMGDRAARLLLEQIMRGGCVDGQHQAITLLFMALGPEQLSRVCMGQLTEYAENMQRLLEVYFGVTFGVYKQKRAGVPSSVPQRVVVSCIGQTLVNLSKRSA